MKLLKVFLKDCISSFAWWVSFVLTITGILGSYFNFFKDFPYTTQILFFFAIICSFISCYNLYSRIAIEYPDAFIKFNKEVNFDDYSQFYKVEKLHKNIKNKCKIDIIDDNKGSMIHSYSDTGIVIKLFHKIEIKNLTNKTLKLSIPNIKLMAVNNIKNKFIIDRLGVSLEKTIFSNSRYFYHWDYIPQWKEESYYKFPYELRGKESCCIFLYLELKLNSFNKNHFDELLNWIRNITLNIDCPFINHKNKKVRNDYVMKYNYKKNEIRNMIEERIVEDKEVESFFKNEL